MSHDFLSFFIAWIAAPGRVGAIAPSGDALAELITREIGPATGPVIELGPGTGAFTYKLLKRGVRPEELTLIEYGSDFVRKLQLRFPGARVLWMDASRLRGDRLYDSDVVGAVVSGLPLLNMSTREVMSVLEGAFSYMRPGGAFYQFTYGMRCPVRRPILDRLGLKATLVDRAMLNVAASGSLQIHPASPTQRCIASDRMSERKSSAIPLRVTLSRAYQLIPSDRSGAPQKAHVTGRFWRKAAAHPQRHRVVCKLASKIDLSIAW